MSIRDVVLTCGVVPVCQTSDQTVDTNNRGWDLVWPCGRVSRGGRGGPNEVGETPVLSVSSEKSQP